MFDVVVVGGGISGLATAEAVLRHAPGTRLVGLEASARTGGCIGTHREDGFVVEDGPEGFLDRFGAIRRLVDTLGLADALIGSDDRHATRWIRRDGALRRVPASLPAFLASDIVSARGKLRMLLEPLQPARPADAGDETVSAFASRRLGTEAAELLIDPIVSGIYAADPGMVSAQASLPQLTQLEASKGSLLGSMFRSSGRVRPLLSLRGGCGQLVDALRVRLGATIECDSPVQSIARTEYGYAIRVGGPRPRVIGCRVLASAAPALPTSRYLAGLDPELAFDIGQVRYASVAVVSLGFRRREVPHPLAGFGYLIPRREDTPVLGVQWSSSVYPGLRAPAGACLLRLFMGGARHPTLARSGDGELAAIAADELRRTLGVTAEPRIRRVARHLEALPQYLLEHRARVGAIEAKLRAYPGLFVGGNGLRGLGMDTLVHQAEQEGQRVAEFLRTHGAASHLAADAREVRA